MNAKRFTVRVLAGLTLTAGVSGSAVAQVKAEDVLARRPVQAHVNVSTPTAAELAGVKAEQVAWPKPANGPAPTGVVVKDASGRLLRQFIDTTGGNRPNIFSFYLNGVEAYREIDTNGNGKPDQYRWLGPNGGKWAADANETGKPEAWYVLSPEELSQELFHAMLTKDAKRVEAMIPSEQDLKAIGLPDAEVARTRQRAAGAVKRMQDTADALKLTDKARWVHLELGLPHVTPADAVGGRDDVVRHKSAVVLVDKGDGKSADVFQVGEIILIGRAWKVIDGPSAGGATPMGDGGVDTLVIDEKLKPIVDRLSKVPPPADAAGQAKYQAARAEILADAVSVTEGAQQEPWLKQMIDAFAAAAEGGDATSFAKLKAWVAQIDKVAPRSAVAAYAGFRLVSAEYSGKLAAAKPDDVAKVQAWWREQLEAFVTKHPASEDAPEAMNRLAVALEYVKDGEAQAKTWYERLARDHASHPYAAKAQGAVKRLTSEGQPFALAGTALDGRPFNAAQLGGKVVVVYYWATWGNAAAGDLKQLAELAKAYGPKGLEVVTVNLDDEPAKAAQVLGGVQLSGAHLHAAGGLDRSPLATAYGIQMVPHAFLVGKDGKVANRNAQVGPMLKDEVEKLLK